MARNWATRFMTLAAGAALLGGCAVTSLIGGALQNQEYQKLIEVHARYDGLKDKKFAVLVDVDLGTRYEFPNLVTTVTDGVSRRLMASVPGSAALPTNFVMAWQYRTADWHSLPYGDVAERLQVDRIVLIDIYEYRLHPPGNRYEWDGVAGANISVIEREAPDPDMVVDTFNITSRYPGKTGYGPESASRTLIETILLNDFIKRIDWLFHDHLEPKYPDKYRPEAP
jgi:hypothetical protein